MTKAPSPLPEGWSEFLEVAQARLEQAIALADAQVSLTPTEIVVDLTSRQSDLARICDRLKHFSEMLESAEQTVQSIDELLEKEERVFRDRLDANAGLKQKMAEQAGGAIG